MSPVGVTCGHVSHLRPFELSDSSAPDDFQNNRDGQHAYVLVPTDALEVL